MPKCQNLSADLVAKKTFDEDEKIKEYGRNRAYINRICLVIHE